jgi:hypothetical protein
VFGHTHRLEDRNTRRREAVYFIYVARDRDHFRDFGTSASHMTHEDFRSVECVIIITLILRSEQRLLYVIFQIFPRFHFPVHCPSLIIFHTFFLFCRFFIYPYPWVPLILLFMFSSCFSHCLPSKNSPNYVLLVCPKSNYHLFCVNTIFQFRLYSALKMEAVCSTPALFNNLPTELLAVLSPRYTVGLLSVCRNIGTVIRCL